MVLLGFSPWWLGGRVLAPLDVLNEMVLPWREDTVSPQVHNHFASDSVTQYLPYRMFAEASYRQDGFVGWNPLIGGGRPQVSNTMALYFDWTMQLHRWLDFWTAWHLGLIGQFLVAGVGMWIFLRSRGLHPATAWVGALAYMGNFQFIAWINHRWALGSFCWMPWVLWAVLAPENKGSRRRLFVPVFLALAFLGGSLQHAVFVILAVVCLWAAEVWRNLFTQKTNATVVLSRRLSSGKIFRITGRYALWGILGIGLAGMMFLPCVEGYLISKGLGESRGGIGYIGGWKQPVLQLLAYPFFVFPSLLGRPQALDLWKVFQTDLFYLPFFGLIPTLLAFFALFRFRTVPLEAWMLIFVGLLLPLTPLVGPLYPRVLLLFILGGVWAFAEIWERDLEIGRKLAKPLLNAFAALAGLWTCASVILSISQAQILGWLTAKFASRPETGQIGQLFTDWMQQRLAQAVADLPIWSLAQAPFVLLALGGLVLWWQKSTGRLSLRLATPLLGGVILLEIALFASRWVTFSDLQKHPAYALTPQITELAEEVGGGRLLVSEKNPRAIAFPSNTLLPYEIPILGLYESIQAPSFRWLPGERTSQANLNLAGVTHGVAADPANEFALLGWLEVQKNPGFITYRNPSVPPKYQLTSLPGAAANVSASLLKESFNHRTLEIPPGHWRLRVAENYGPGWQFRLGQSPWQAVVKADDGAQSMDLPFLQTSTILEMRYHHRLVLLGQWASLATLLLWLVWGAHATSRAVFGDPAKNRPRL